MRLILRSITNETSTVVTYRFTPESPLHWLAGQSIRLEVPGEYGFEERRFTIVTAPYEGDIAITTKLSDSDFKQALSNLQPNDIARGYAIEGDFTWRPSKAKPVFIASGIGVTPYISILKQLAYEHKPLNIDMWYANRGSEFPFEQLLGALQVANPGFLVRYRADQRIHFDHILTERNRSDLADIYISGPSSMVAAVSEQCLHYGIPESRIITDWFTGRIGWEHS